MSRSRFGSFRVGKTRYFNNWDILKVNTIVTAPVIVNDFDYTKAKGIWNLKSTTQFPKSKDPFSAEYVTSTSVGSTSSSYTFSSVSIGAANVYRTIAVTVSWNAGAAGRLLNTATIGGINATVCQISDAAGYERSAIIYAEVPTGTTGNIVLNFNGSIGYGIAIGIFRLLNVTEVLTPVYRASNNATSTYTTVINVKTGDYIISALGTGNAAANWTNTTERYTYRKYQDYLEGASTTAATTGNLSISATGSPYGVLTTVGFR